MRRLPRLIVMLALALALLPAGQVALAARQAATELTLSPTSGPLGTVVTITGRGAQPNGTVEIIGGFWETRDQCFNLRSQGQGWSFGQTTADGAGTFVFQATFPNFRPENRIHFVRFGAYSATGITPIYCFEVTDGPVGRTFPETGKTVQGRFLAYWEANGGLAINGFPISDEFTETLEDGKAYTVQYFERVRMELHPENADPQYQVLLGAFGRRIRPADPPVAAIPGATYFAETGHNVTRPEFVAYWQANGGLAQFGFPITEEFTEMLDGQQYQVQYFERARFEWHPENADPYRVLLGQFGRAVCGGRCH